MEDCFICAKHRDMDAVPGGVLVADEHVIVSHLPHQTPGGDAETVYLGRLLVEPRRHVRELAELTPDEAGALGRMAAVAGAALMQSEDAEHVYAASIGDQVPHLHLHLIPRYPGTPREFWWLALEDWPDAPFGDPGDVAALVARLRAVLSEGSSSPRQP